MAARDKKAMQLVLDALEGKPIHVHPLKFPPHPWGSANIPFMLATAAAISGKYWATKWCRQYLDGMLYRDLGLGYTEPLSPIYMESMVACWDALEVRFSGERLGILARDFYLAARAYQSLGTMLGTYPVLKGWAPRAVRRWQGSVTLLAGDRGEIYPWSASTICLGKELGIGRWRGGTTPRKLNFLFWPSWIQDICRMEREGYLLDGNARKYDLSDTINGDNLFLNESLVALLPPLRTRAQWVQIPGVGRAGWIDKGRNPNTRPLLGWVAEYRPNGEVGKVTQLMPHKNKRNYGKKWESRGRCVVVEGMREFNMFAKTNQSKELTAYLSCDPGNICWVKAETVL